jgi:hypothetical protein
MLQSFLYCLRSVRILVYGVSMYVACKSFDPANFHDQTILEFTQAHRSNPGDLYSLALLPLHREHQHSLISMSVTEATR